MFLLLALLLLFLGWSGGAVFGGTGGCCLLCLEFCILLSLLALLLQLLGRLLLLLYALFVLTAGGMLAGSVVFSSTQDVLLDVCAELGWWRSVGRRLLAGRVVRGRVERHGCGRVGALGVKRGVGSR